MPTALQYADWLVEYCANDLGAPIDSMSLEKHLYYAQSFRLALTGQSLFEDEFEAWKQGPVVKSVWDVYSGAGFFKRITRFFTSVPQPPALDEDVKQILRESVSLFSVLSAVRLSIATHMEDPWLRARGNLPRNEGSRRIIPKGEMEAYYSSLMGDGEEALSRHSLLGSVPEPRWGWLYVAGICARQMRMHPFFAIGSAMWGPPNLLSEIPEPDNFPAELYPQPPRQDRSREDVFETQSVDELKGKIRRLWG